MKEERIVLLGLIAEARAAGARLRPCCKVVGLNTRTIQRWISATTLEDQRRGPKTTPKNKLTAEERAAVIAVATSPEYRGLSPKQIVPALADKKIYLASESSFYRILKASDLQHHRANSKPATHNRPAPLKASGPNQVYSWDITYMKAPVKGSFFYLYLVMDVWSRKVVGYRVEDHESSELAALLIRDICEDEGIEFDQLALHADNGSPMKGATMLTTLQSLGVFASFSRPSVSNDNAYSEALFRTFKYRPGYPRKPFSNIASARTWVDKFTVWYNEKHLHSALAYVTPSDRHTGADVEILANRRALYEAARAAKPNRWSGKTRNWDKPGDVVLNNYGHDASTASGAQCAS